MFSKILIANRGEIACRVIKTARRMGIATVAVYSDADREALHVRLADEAVHIGAPPAGQSYLNAGRIIAACTQTGAEAVHPGYGFLSENAAFCAALEKENITFIGPPRKAIEAMGDKIAAKKIAAGAGVPAVPGHPGIIKDAREAVRIARKIGYPVMIKASAGGGGKGMRIAHSDTEAREGFERSRSEAASSFGDDRIFIEKYIANPRHIEIQIIADGDGNVIHLGERECSIQRRNQKVIEEAPSPFLDADTRAAMGAGAVALARAVGYVSAGTVEFIVDSDRQFYFLEMNTRLQVEHPVTELVTGLDLVELMLRVAAGGKLPFTQDDVRLRGWAIESRVYAEDPYRHFLPSSGRLIRYRPPSEHRGETLVVRNDTGVFEGGGISTFYDPMIAKLCVWAPDRGAAAEAMADALDGFEIEGIGHNIPFLQVVMGQARFRDGELTTGYIAEEFAGGFEGVTLEPVQMRDVVAVAAMMEFVVSERAGQISGGTGNWMVFAGGEEVPVSVTRTKGGWSVALPDVVPAVTGFDWQPGRTLAIIEWGDGRHGVLKVNRASAGYRIRTRGADLDVKVLKPNVAKLMVHMPVKLAPDMSNYLVCPMPGQIVSLDAAGGDIVEDGQPLAIVEAMKMENVLRAQKRARVARVHVKTGDVLAVDAVIMEFEEV